MEMGLLEAYPHRDVADLAHGASYPSRPTSSCLAFSTSSKVVQSVSIYFVRISYMVLSNLTGISPCGSLKMLRSRTYNLFELSSSIVFEFVGFLLGLRPDPLGFLCILIVTFRACIASPPVFMRPWRNPIN